MPSQARPAAPALIDPNQRYSLPESQAALRISAAKLYKDMRDGRIRCLRDGARTYIPGSELIRLSTLPAA